MSRSLLVVMFEVQLKVHSSYTLQGKTKEDKLNAAVLCALLAGHRYHSVSTPSPPDYFYLSIHL